MTSLSILAIVCSVAVILWVEWDIMHRSRVEQPKPETPSKPLKVWVPVNRWEYVLRDIREVDPGSFFVLFDERFEINDTDEFWDALCE